MPRTNSVYNGSLTREQFLFHEMRTTAALVTAGLSEKQIVEKVCKENLFQYPTEREVAKMTKVCLTRLKSMSDDTLVQAIAEQPSYVAKQICLYAMMKYNRLVWDFMTSVIGEKYRQQDMSLTRADLNVFFIRLQEQDESVASWKESTITKIKQVLLKVLIDNEYIDSADSGKLNPVLITSLLENSLRLHNDTAALAAFNCFS